MTDTSVMDPKAQVAKNLKELRIACGHSREKLARLSGVSAASINSIERGDRWPREENIEALAKALGVTWEGLFTYHLDPERAVVPVDELARAVQVINANWLQLAIKKRRT